MVAVRNALRMLWKDTCTVYEYSPVKQANKTTIHEEIAVIVDELCKLSFSRLTTVNQTDTNAEVVQIVKLFIDESLNIKAGSKIVIQHGGRLFIYGYSGESGVFSNHQEIVLKPWNGWN